MLSKEDQALWDTYTQTVKPLKRSGFAKVTLLFTPKRWFKRDKVHPVPEILDLHQMTLQEAFATFEKFLQTHFILGTKKIEVITGRGKNNSGLLKKEFPLWLDNPEIRDKIRTYRAQNEGAFEIELRKKC